MLTEEDLSCVLRKNLVTLKKQAVGCLQGPVCRKKSQEEEAQKDSELLVSGVHVVLGTVYTQLSGLKGFGSFLSVSPGK